MRVFRSISDLPNFKNAVVTIGSFDGVHKGHQQLLHRINQLASEVDGESVLVTFHPHPRKIIFPKDTSLRLLNTLEEKLRLCEVYGIDNVVVVPFSVEFSKQSPREYIEKFLIGSFQPKYIVIGYDHRFGLNREGDINLLKEYEDKEGFKVIEIKKQELENIAISSSKIRNALSDGDVEIASTYLGRDYALNGKVVHGDKIGHTIGFPTANIQLNDRDKLIPKDSVYAVKCTIEGLDKEGMMYIGRRPTLANEQSHKSIEVHLFDFDDTIYGASMKVDLVKYIRDGQKFDSLDDLKTQLHKDEVDSRQALSDIIKVETNPSEQSKVCIAILNYNGLEYLESFLPSVLYSSKNPINVAVIDNASTDASVDYLKEWHPEVQLVELTKNYGFAEGYNQGLKHINAEYIVLLNSDVLVEEYWLDPILTLLDGDKNIGAVQPKILSLEHKDHFEYAGAAGGFMDSWGYPYCRGRIFDHVEKDEGQYDELIECDWASGAAMVMRSDLYHNMGGFDGDYFAHMEEIDLCWRVRRAGYKIVALPSSIIYHLGGGTLDYQNPRKVFLNFRNSLFTLLKNESLGKLFWLFFWRLLLDGIAGIKYVLEGNAAATLAIIKAHFAVYGKFGHTFRKRAVYNRLIQKYKIGPQVDSKTRTTSILYSHFVKGKKAFKNL